MAKPKNNTSGRVGVMFDKARGLFASRIQVNCKTVHLGRFKTFEEAVLARENAESFYGFHDNHGREDGRSQETS